MKKVKQIHQAIKRDLKFNGGTERKKFPSVSNVYLYYGSHIAVHLHPRSKLIPIHAPNVPNLFVTHKWVK